MKIYQLTDDLTLNENMPKIAIDEEEGNVTLTGKCLPEEATQMQKQLEKYLKPLLDAGNLHLIFRLDFFNTASSKIFELYLSKLDHFYKNGGNIKISWCFQEDDEDMEEAGDEFATLVDFPFELVKIDNVI